MSYCRFRNTVRDLADCLEHLHDPLIAGSKDGEHAARLELVNLCATILEECGGEHINRADIQIEERAAEEELPRTRPPGQS